MSEPVPAQRPRVWTTPPGLALCAHAEIAEPGSRGFVLQIGEAVFQGFVIRKGAQTAGWVDRCPHAGFPLAIQQDRYLTADGGLILCGWHGAVFDPIGGRCVGGPGAGGALTPWPITVEDGIVRTA